MPEAAVGALLRTRKTPAEVKDVLVGENGPVVIWTKCEEGTGLALLERDQVAVGLVQSAKAADRIVKKVPQERGAADDRQLRGKLSRLASWTHRRLPACSGSPRPSARKGRRGNLCRQNDVTLARDGP